MRVATCIHSRGAILGVPEPHALPNATGLHLVVPIRTKQMLKMTENTQPTVKTADRDRKYPAYLPFGREELLGAIAPAVARRLQSHHCNRTRCGTKMLRTLLSQHPAGSRTCTSEVASTSHQSPPSPGSIPTVVASAPVPVPLSRPRAVAASVSLTISRPRPVPRPANSQSSGYPSLPPPLPRKQTCCQP